MITAREIMSDNVLTLRPNGTVKDAIELLLDKGISGVPVTDDEGGLVGVVSEFALLAIAYDREIENDVVANHMTTEVLTVEVDAPISKAADLCIAHRVRRLPVMDNGRLVGLISRRDVLRSVYEANSTTSAA